MCTQDELKAILNRVDEHLTNKEAVASRVLYDLKEQIKSLETEIKTREEKQKKMDEIITAWQNAKGFARVTKWFFYLFLAVGAGLTAIKSFPIMWK